MEAEITNKDITPLNINVETDYWYYGVRILAFGDFDDDGLEDVLISFYNKAKEGTLLYFEPAILHRVKSGGIIMAIPALEFLKQRNILSIK